MWIILYKGKTSQAWQVLPFLYPSKAEAISVRDALGASGEYLGVEIREIEPPAGAA